MDGKHNGYVDAYNTALLFATLQQTPDFVVNSFYSNLGIENNICTFPYFCTFLLKRYLAERD